MCFYLIKFYMNLLVILQFLLYHNICFQVENAVLEREDEVQPKAKEVFQRLEGRMEEGVRAGKKSLPTRGNEVVVGNKKVENSSSPEEQSEFAKVFAALRGGGRVD